MTTSIVRDFPHAVRVLENVWVPLPDGTRLAAKIWLPDDVETQPAPAVFEFLPYRKGDGTASRDEVMYRYLAGHGYAGVRVDLRGHGESDGIPDDEYTRQEHQDAPVGMPIRQCLRHHREDCCRGALKHRRAQPAHDPQRQRSAGHHLQVVSVFDEGKAGPHREALDRGFHEEPNA